MSQLKELQELRTTKKKLEERITSFSSTPSTSNSRKTLRGLVEELHITDSRIAELLTKMIENEELTKEEWVVTGVVPEVIREEEDEEDEYVYHTQFEAVKNQPGAFFGNPGVLRKFGIFDKKTSNAAIRKTLYEQQLQNYRVQEKRKKRKSAALRKEEALKKKMEDASFQELNE